MDSALSVKDLSLNIGGAKILDGITLDVAHNETLGIIGPNGAGKTSFFNLLSGIRKPSRGEIFTRREPTKNIPLPSKELQVSRLKCIYGFKECTRPKNGGI